jgi:hypothetical protein
MIIYVCIEVIDQFMRILILIILIILMILIILISDTLL